MTNSFFSTGISTVVNQDLDVSQLAPNNYLTIVWKDTTSKTNLDIDNQKSQTYTNALTNALSSAIDSGAVKYFGQNKYINLESIARYLAQNTIKNSTQRRVVNALIEVASGNGNLTDDLINLSLNCFGGIANDVASKLGFSDPYTLFSQLAGQNTIEFLGTLGNSTQTFLNNAVNKLTFGKVSNMFNFNFGSKKGLEQNEYVGLLLGLTTSDTESMEITIPRHKVEDGSDYTTHLLPQPWKKEFNVTLTNKMWTEDFDIVEEINAIEYTKNKMIEIAKSHTLFDIYIRLSDGVMYKKTNVCFSSLTFTKDENSGNGYSATFTIEPVNSFKVKVFTSTKKFSTSNNILSGAKNTIAKATSTGKSLLVGYSSTFKDKSGQTKSYNNFNDALSDAKGSKVCLIKKYTNGKYTYSFLKNYEVTKVDGVPVLTLDTEDDRIVVSTPYAMSYLNKGKKLKSGISVNKKNGSVVTSKGLTYTIYGYQ